jgi:hypothetical protein
MSPQYALAVVAVAGLFLAALGTVALLAPPRAERFLLGFARTATRHYSELIVRLLVGAAFVASAPRLPGSAAFHAIGWVLLVTTAVLFLIPWRLHQRFTAQAVPKALRLLPAVGLASMVGGLAILAALYAAAWGPGGV